ncbi:MAG: hypothetical protein ACE15E_01755 [Acidobacteriota bacterium]
MALVLLVIALLSAASFPQKSDSAVNTEYRPYIWPDDPPAGCSFKQSQQITGISFTGRYANYTKADTWYLTWAADGNNYSAWTDGSIDGYFCNSNFLVQCIGQAKITGEDPLNLSVVNLGKIHSGPQYYPCVSVIANGVFYIGSYSAFNDIGHFEGFRYSKDWDHFTEQLKPKWSDPHWVDARDPDRNFFDERGQAKFRVPHAVVFGQDNRLSPDGRIYLSAHGNSVPGTKNNWDKGDAIYLCRVEARPEEVTDPAAYEFFAGHDDAGQPRWSGRVEDSRPILSWAKHLGSESITYIPGLKRYILMTARLQEREDNLSYNALVLWESARITGPYEMVHYLRNWGPQSYFPAIPARFISEDGKTAWLVCSANYRGGEPNPPQCRYALSMHEIVFNGAGSR